MISPDKVGYAFVSGFKVSRFRSFKVTYPARDRLLLRESSNRFKSPSTS